MPTLVKVRRWGNSLGLRLPKSFALQRDITDGTTIRIDDIAIADIKRQRKSRYKLKDILGSYTKPPKEVNFPPVGRELL